MQTENRALPSRNEEEEAASQEDEFDPQQQKQITETGSVVTHNHGRTTHCLTYHMNLPVR